MYRTYACLILKMITEVVFIFVTLILSFILIIGNSNENYWRKRGVTFHRRNKVMGLFWDFVTQDRAFFLLFQDLYKQYPDDPAVAFGAFLTPALYVKDLTNVHHVMQTDFHSFNQRAIAFNENDKLALNIVFLHGPRWKLLRHSMTPLFTGSKLKKMFYIIDRSAQDFVTYLKTDQDKLKGDSYEEFNLYSCAALAASVFGIGTESTMESPFLEIVRQGLMPSFWKNVKFSMSSLCTPFFKATNMSMFSVEEDFFIDAMKHVFRMREKENVKQHDFVDLCINLQKNGKLIDPDTGFELEPTDEILAAQAFIFFLAGVEPCSMSIYNTMIEMGRNPHILQRVHEEIDEVFEKSDGQLTYDAVSKMEYLESVVSESLRMYPSVGFITRECTQDTVLPVGNIKVAKGTKIFTPVFELHRDPKYFPDPDVFDPERFSREGKRSVNDALFLPFGIGSRTCIGLRYAMLQMKTCIAHVLRDFTVKTIIQDGGIKYKKAQFQVKIKNADFEFIIRKQL